VTRSELIERLARAIAKREVFFFTEAQAASCRLKNPTRAQRNANPGNVREWRDGRNRPYPRCGGYVDFVVWASDSLPGASIAELSRMVLRKAGACSGKW
jgi:hypothetical protein